MSTWFATVPVKFSHIRHPLQVGPHDLIEVEAPDEDAAATAVLLATGRNDSWCSILSPDEAEALKPMYYPGRVVKLEAQG